MMRKEKLPCQIIFAFATVMVILTFMFIWPRAPLADSGKDYVIVIDVSTSMQDIFDEVKQIAKSTLTRAKAGDNVAVITFGEQATLLNRKQIHGKADIETLQKQLEELYPTDYSTYINRGLEKGLSELRYLFERNADRERVLLWLSDDKDNPPEELGEGFLTLDTLREDSKDFEPGNEWFAYDAPLSEVKNEALQDFVTWARRTTFRIAIKEPTVSLGSFEDGNVKKKVVLTFEPRHPGAAGLEFMAGARLVDPKDPSRSLPVSISPQRVVASGHLWQQEFNVAFAGDPGEYKGFFSFESLSGSALDVKPRAVAFTAMIAPPKVAAVEPVVPEEPEPTGLLAEAKKKGIIATEDRPPGLTRPEKPLLFGPLDPGKKDSKIVGLFLNKEADPEGITHDLAIQLPEWIDIESKVFGRGTRLAAEITISVKKDAQLSEDTVLQEAYEGSMRFKSDEAGVEVLPVYMPIRVTLSTDRVRWGKKLLPDTGVGQVKARRMTFEELTKEMGEKEKAEAEEVSPILSAVRGTYARLKSRYVFFPILGAVVLVLILLLYRMRPPSELFVGELVVIKDASDSKMKNVNLKRIGSLHGKDVLTLGSSPKADIRLNHPSVSPIHCRLSARTVENQTEIAIHPLKGCSLKFNDIDQAEKARLSDKDLIGIGEFILLFSNPEAEQEVVVHFLDGRTMRGTPVSWDIGAASFELLRTDISEGEETTDDINVTNFADLKAVFFMQDKSGSRPTIPRDRINTGELLEATFLDGEKIEGHPLTDYSDVARRFYLIPKEMPNIISILVERNSIKEAVKRKVQGEPEAARYAGLFGSLRKRKGTAPAE
ncbi:MAG: VWA domain-containing protein [Candidatus Hydrogenedentota bacterium]|nr:MAG: VWA domain-containing protein [Candidatus Hydrogenedentota bacterium]